MGRGQRVRACHRGQRGADHMGSALQGGPADQRNDGHVEPRLAEQTTRYVQVVDLLLQEILLHVRHLGIETPEQFREMLGDATTHALVRERMVNLAHGGGNYRSSGLTSGDPSFVSVKALEDYPLAINVAVRQYEALATWRQQTVLVIAG
jgi:hypothetical protein